jgi:DNA invertase Pin-like site-specific DNA recombinase
MNALSPSQKIGPRHLERRAFIYVRQSSLAQVRHHTASTARQYDLSQRAQQLGWTSPQIVILDQDQGQSGASAVGRDGFATLIAEVGLGHAGAVLSLEVSRLARSCSDWYRLLEICALTDTLVIDEEGIYDPGQYNDRLLLGFKGTMSEAELHWLHARLQGGKLQKAQQGQLRFRPPVGLVFDPANRLVVDPDEEVQSAVRLLFTLFAQHGSAMKVVQYFTTQHLRFPNRLWGQTHEGELVWEALRHSRALSVLHNPAYAGAYVYGRTTTRTRLLPGEAPRVKGRTRQVDLQDWPIVLRDVHSGYLSWEQFLANQQRLDDNRTYRHEERRGAVREGAALLQGIALCGRCGRRMGVRYCGNQSRPHYECDQTHTDYGVPTCQVLRGDGIDAAVALAFLEALQPAQIEVSLSALQHLQDQERQIQRQWQLRLERAGYEADLARRRFLSVDPENRLVARSLERDWNDKLSEVARLEREQASLPTQSALMLGEAERARILALSHDLPTVWNALTTTSAERKQLLRLLVKDVTLTRRETTIAIAIRWQTQACTLLEIGRPPRSFEVRRTDPRVVARIRELAAEHPDAQIAALLNAEGLHPGLKGGFTRSKVQWIRYAHDIKAGCPDNPMGCTRGRRGDGRYSTRAAAELLNVNIATIADWCEQGRLDSVRSTPRGPRWVHLTPEIIAALRKSERQHWKRRSLPVV